MHVDRVRFLEIVGAIAAATAWPIACGGSAGAERAPVVVTPMVVGTTVDAGGEASASAEADAAPAAAPPPVVASLGMWSPAYDPAPPPETCGMLKCGGPFSEGMGSLRKACAIYSEMLRPEPFQRFLACLLARNKTADTCDLRRVTATADGCLEHWADAPTIDPATAAKCQPIVASCAARGGGDSHKPLSMETCQKMLSVTSAKYDRKMIHCAMESCGAAPGSCHLAY